MAKTAIVLSGGGSCGAYQIGVWKALRKLNIDYQIVTGVSVGALNGLMMVQKDYAIAYKMWSNIDYSLLFKHFIDANDQNLKNKDIYMKYVDGFFENGGMDISNLEATVANKFDAEKFYNSNIDFGIVVYNLTKLKSESFTKSQISADQIKDYVIASATCFPAFKIKKIDDQKYIDGGYGDNLPINLAVKMGATKIIAVDLEQIGLKKMPQNKTVDVDYIRPKNDIGSFLVFDKYQARKNIKYGYYDTLKKYGHLKGDSYTFYKLGYDYFIKKINKKFHKYLEYLENSPTGNKINKLKNKFAQKLLNFEDLNVNDVVNISINVLGNSLSIDDTKVYFISQFNYCLRKKIKNIDSLDSESIKNKIKNNQISGLLGSKYIVKYIYDNLQSDEQVNLSLLYTIFKREFWAAVYLICIE